MTMRAKRPTVVLLFLSFFSIAALAIAAFVDDSGKVYSAVEKAFYLSPEDSAWIRPGLKLQIQNISIPADRKPVVTFRITDDKGVPLDRTGVLTPGTVTSNWVLAYIPQDANQYVAYTVRTQKSPITNVSAVQASSDTNSGVASAYVSLGDGTYRYTFATALPATYDTTATHTLGVYAVRDLREWGLSRYITNPLQTWVPDGRQVTKVRDVVATASCNQCHDPLGLHGGSRQEVLLCNLCHTPQTMDPDTGNTVDMKVMVHKIHMGGNLPSGNDYIIIGNQQSVNNYSEVTYPQDIRNCTTCHKDTTQVNNWLLNPTRATCGSCHDNIDWTTGKNHVAGPQLDDKYCANCHWPESEYEYDATIAGAHIAPDKSQQLVKPKFEMLDVTNTAPGQSPTVKFKITDKNGKPISPSIMTGSTGRLGLTIGGPTSDYRWYLQEAANTATVDAGVASYTFKGVIPATATGTYVMESEGYVTTILNPGTDKELSYRDAFANVVKPFAVTGTVTNRRAVVDLAKCNKCHDNLQLHGNNRNQIEACVICHNPATTDAARRTQAVLPAETIDMKIMIHKIHTGAELENDYTVYGFGNTANNFNEVTYPGDRRNCTACHVGTSYQVPLPDSVTDSTTPRSFWTPMKPTAAACTGCHDSVDAAAHAFINTAPFGESCPVCHEEGADFAVTKAHAR
jgi:OmcA/MtrC family decaheme c-type cytochrome